MSSALPFGKSHSFAFVNHLSWSCRALSTLTSPSISRSLISLHATRPSDRCREPSSRRGAGRLLCAARHLLGGHCAVVSLGRPGASEVVPLGGRSYPRWVCA